MQFVMLDIDLINDSNLTNDEIVAYALLCDRMKSSRTSKQFFDAKSNDFYVIYTLDQMAKSLKVSVRKVGQIFTKLVKAGLLAKKKQFSKADKLFLPKFVNPQTQNMQSVQADSASPQTQNMQTNQSHLNQKNQSEIDTVNTRNTHNAEKQNYSPISKWKNSVCGKLKVSEFVVDQILEYTNKDLQQAHKIMGIILNAKTNVAKANGLLNNPISRFENNTNLGSKMAVKLKHIFSYLPNAVDERARYLMTAMKTFFLEAFGLKKDEMVTPVAKGTQKIVEEPVPYWMEDGFDTTAKPATEEQKLEVKRLLEEFYKN